jgi:hypothetical protein
MELESTKEKPELLSEGSDGEFKFNCNCFADHSMI